MAAVLLYPRFYQNYVSLCPARDTVEMLEYSGRKVQESFDSLSEEKWNYAYASGKWTARLMLRHMLDTEIVFLYRALSFARDSSTELPGFDENSWAEASLSSLAEPRDLLQEFSVLRQSSLHFFRSLNSSDLEKTGVANGGKFNIRSIALIIAGHNLHHLKILEERYL